MATIGFATVQTYLTGLSNANGTLGNSPHGAFWLGTYEEFIAGTLPVVTYRGAAIPLIWKDAPLLSPFFMIMVEPKGWGGRRQMPGGGPFISADGTDIPLDDGTSVKTEKIREDLTNWLKNGFPKDPLP